MASKLTVLLQQLDTMEAESRKAEEAYEANPESTEAEAAFDAAYEKEYDALMACADQIVKMTNGNILRNTARDMIQQKRKSVERLAMRYCDENENTFGKGT